MAGKKKYGLYVVRPEDIGEEERHYLITPDYCLLYTKNKPPQKSAAVTHTDRLPALAAQWLKEQIEQIRREYAAEHKTEILRQAKTFYDAFRKELEAERQHLKEGDGGADPETEGTGSI